MAKNINLTSQRWIDIIFEGKNQSYGAYVLRQQSSKRHTLAFVVTMAFTIIAMFSIHYAVKANMKAKEIKIGYDDGINLSDLGKPEIPEDIIEHRVEPPPPIELAKTIKFTSNIAIKEDDLVREEDQMKGQDELLKDPLALISTIDNKEGRDDGFGVDPKDLAGHKVIVNNPAPVEEIFNLAVVDHAPSFPGGEKAMYEWLSKNINYPVIAQENNIQGRVTLQFVVGKNGEIIDIIIARGVDSSLDKEAVRVVSTMPRWIPGKQGGNAVKVRYTLPVQFKLQ